MKVTLNRRMRLGGRMYATGDAASLARQHARVLIATGRAKTFVEPTAAPPTPAPVPAVVTQDVVHESSHAASAQQEIHHDFHQTSPAAAKAAAEAVRTQQKAAAKKTSTGQKVEK